jgi:hypothetical protein
MTSQNFFHKFSLGRNFLGWVYFHKLVYRLIIELVIAVSNTTMRKPVVCSFHYLFYILLITTI